MIAWLARLGVCIELLVLGWVVHAQWAAGAGVLRIFAWVLLVAVAWRSVVVLAPFTIVAIHRLRDGRGLDIAHLLQALAGEWWAKSLSFGLYQPFAPWMLGAEPAPAHATARPVLLIHGYLCNRGSWFGVRRLLQKTWAGPVYTISLEPPFGRIDDYHGQVSQRVDEILRDTGADSVHLVCHSMGGLVARAWLRQPANAERTTSLTTIGSPHHGTRLAGWGIGRNVQQMHEGSEWLRRLAEAEQGVAPGFPVLCLYTEQDNLVYPPESGALPWAINERLQGIGHVELQSSPVVAQRVVEHLRAAEAHAKR